MQKERGVLLLPDPTGGAQMQTYPIQGLVFHENESLLSQAQTALWNLRRAHSWVCVAAQGEAACIALALAAQLPVERVALLGKAGEGARRSRELRRLRAYARRNLALLTSEILLVGDAAQQARDFLHGNRHCRMCALPALEMEHLAAPWERLCENNLLIQGKCV